MSDLPPFPEFKPLRLDMGCRLSSRLAAAAPLISEFTFANLYLFRETHRYQVSQWQGLALLVARGYDGGAYGFPPVGEGPVEEGARLLCGYLADRDEKPEIFPVPEPWVERWFGSDAWVATPDRDQADYIYRRDDLARLHGRRYHKRRNRLLKFLREHAEGYEYEEMGPEHETECVALADGWCHIRCSRERPSTFGETEATKEAIVRRRELGLKGAVIRLGGRVRAFCLGEELNPETFVVHFEKAEPGMEGLAQLVNRDFCLRSLRDYEYVNREQDLGDDGLRRAKQAYYPAFMGKKFRVCPRSV